MAPVKGAGGSTYVLVPGAGGAAWFWHRVVACLDERGLASVAVDLPASDENAGLPEYIDLVIDAVEQAAPDGELVMVGQSIGGFTASAACARLPVAELVLVNAMIPKPGETAGEWWANVDDRSARRAKDVREGRDPDAEFDLDTYFFHDVPADVVAAGAEHAHDESDAIFAAPWPLDAWPDVPTRVIVGRDDRFFPAEFQRRVSEERLGITPEELPGGHLAPLSHPAEFVALLVGD